MGACSSLAICFLHCSRICGTKLFDFMRRVLRSAFLLLVVATLVAPLPTGGSAAAPVPICCLGQGEHHCLGQMLGGGPESQGFSAGDKCPYAPLALSALHSPNVASPVGSQAITTTAQSAPIAIELNCLASSSSFDSCPERGPPTFSLN